MIFLIVYFLWNKWSLGETTVFVLLNLSEYGFTHVITIHLDVQRQQRIPLFCLYWVLKDRKMRVP